MSSQLAVYVNMGRDINGNGALRPLVFQGGWNQEPRGRGLTKPMVLLVWVEGGCPSLQLTLYTYLQCAHGVSTVPRAAMTPVTRWRPQPSHLQLWSWCLLSMILHPKPQVHFRR